jgi:hypothetical protein
LADAIEPSGRKASGIGAQANIDASGEGISHPARPKLSTRQSRLALYSRRFAPTMSCGPLSAAVAATWIGVNAP